MTDSIKPSASSWYPIPEGATPEENDAQMSIAAVHPVVSNASLTPPRAERGDTEAAGTASPGARLLVARFSQPTVPVAKPSVLEATWNCAVELANVAITTLVVAGAAPETFGTSLLALGRIGYAGAAFDRCATRDEAQQVKEQTAAAAAADCTAHGGVALSTFDGSPICAELK